MLTVCKGSVPEIRRLQIDALLKMEDKEDMHHILNGVELKPFQAIGSMFMYLSGRCLLGDSPGLGKTIQVAGALKLAQLYGELKKVICIVPTSSIYQFTSEIEYTTGLKMLPIFGNKNQINKIWEEGIDNYDGIVTNYSAFSQGTELTKKLVPVADLFNACVLDESLVIQNKETIIYQTVFQIFKRMDFKFCLNGTSLTRNLEQFYNQIYCLDPQIEMTLSDINNIYGVRGVKNGRDNQLIGYARTHTVPKHFIYHYIGRDRRELNLETDASFEPIYVEPSEQQLTLLDSMNYNEVLFCPSKFGIKLSPKYVPALQTLIDRVKLHLPTSKVVIYSKHIDIKPIMKNYLEALVPHCKVGIIDGEVSNPEERERIRLDFEKGETNVLITSITKSLNLGSANVMIMYGLTEDWAQAILRIDRGVEGGSTKLYEVLVHLGTPQVNQIKRLRKNEALLNDSFNKNYRMFSTLDDMINLSEQYYYKYGKLTESE